MEFFEVIKKRHSIRSYKDMKIENDKLIKILETANLSPSAGNLQAYEVFLIKDKTKKRQLIRAAWGQDFMAEAPAVLVFCANPLRSAKKYGKRGERLYCVQDATIAASYAQLAATALGLGSVWVGAFDENEVLKVIGARNLLPICIMPIGYPNEIPEISERRNLKDIVHQI